jgi:hypothetical protein
MEVTIVPLPFVYSKTFRVKSWQCCLVTVFHFDPASDTSLTGTWSYCRKISNRWCSFLT